MRGAWSLMVACAEVDAFCCVVDFDVYSGLPQPQSLILPGAVSRDITRIDKQG